MKICSSCCRELPETAFHKRKASPDGFAYICKACRSAYDKSKPPRSPEYDRQYRKANRDRLKAARKKYYEANRSRFKIKSSERYIKNRVAVTTKIKEWRSLNKDKYKAWVRSYRAEPKRRVRLNISKYLTDCLYTGKMGKRLAELVDWTPDQLARHLESLFKDGMNWSNYGSSSGAKDWWSVDHKKSVYSFGYPLPGTTEFRECWSLSNLQPMWHTENSSKQHLRDG